MTKKFEKGKLYTYTFTLRDNKTESVKCKVSGGSAKIWVAGAEPADNTNVFVAGGGQGTTSVFPGPKDAALTAGPGGTWVLHIRGANSDNLVASDSLVDVTVPSLGTWSPIPSET